MGGVVCLLLVYLGCRRPYCCKVPPPLEEHGYTDGYDLSAVGLGPHNKIAFVCKSSELLIEITLLEVVIRICKLHGCLQFLRNLCYDNLSCTW